MHFTVDLESPGGEEACHRCCLIGGITGNRLGESGNFQIKRLFQYFLQEICIVVNGMYHIIGNQQDDQSIQVKSHHELHKRPQASFPVVQFHHVMYTMKK